MEIIWNTLRLLANGIRLIYLHFTQDEWMPKDDDTHTQPQHHNR